MKKAIAALLLFGCASQRAAAPEQAQTSLAALRAEIRGRENEPAQNVFKNVRR